MFLVLLCKLMVATYVHWDATTNNCILKKGTLIARCVHTAIIIE